MTTNNSALFPQVVSTEILLPLQQTIQTLSFDGRRLALNDQLIRDIPQCSLLGRVMTYEIIKTPDEWRDIADITELAGKEKASVGDIKTAVRAVTRNLFQGLGFQPVDLTYAVEEDPEKRRQVRAPESILLHTGLREDLHAESPALDMQELARNSGGVALTVRRSQAAVSRTASALKASTLPPRPTPKLSERARRLSEAQTQNLIKSAFISALQSEPGSVINSDEFFEGVVTDSSLAAKMADVLNYLSRAGYIERIIEEGIGRPSSANYRRTAKPYKPKNS